MMASPPLGLRMIVDLVPNHCSDQHPLFQAARGARRQPRAGHVRLPDGTGPEGHEPPNNWQSHSAVRPGPGVRGPMASLTSGTCHLFDSSQPDFNWDNPAVHTEFERILRFWLDRGAPASGDVAHALVKAPGCLTGEAARRRKLRTASGHEAPMFGSGHSRHLPLLAEDSGPVLRPRPDPCAEQVWTSPAWAHWSGPTNASAFNFPYLHAGLDLSSPSFITDS
jgi:alpha-glucosidase